MDFKTTTVLDASTLKDYMACPRRYWFRHVRGLTRVQHGIALGFGLAFHEGMDVAYKWLQKNPGENFTQEIIEAATGTALATYHSHVSEETASMEENRTPGKLQMLMGTYFQIYPAERFQVVSVEEPFALGVTQSGYTTAAFSKGEPLPSDGRLFTWVGKMDVVAKWDYGLTVIDHKTSSQFGQTYDNSWSPSVQMAGYIATLQTMFPEETVQGAMINAIRVVKTVPKDAGDNFKRIITTRRPDELTQHHISMLAWAERIKDDTTYPQNTESCTMYGECPYRLLCLRYPNAPTMEQLPVDEGFEEETWNPLERLAQL